MPSNFIIICLLVEHVSNHTTYIEFILHKICGDVPYHNTYNGFYAILIKQALNRRKLIEYTSIHTNVLIKAIFKIKVHSINMNRRNS